ncbi:unnamed protein product [Ectocarpus sp. CCAP 1310/34]|nr:unnamed protein product [Ectocarpus sp. CCAP 1310/34]
MLLARLPPCDATAEAVAALGNPDHGSDSSTASRRVDSCCGLARKPAQDARDGADFCALVFRQTY